MATANAVQEGNRHGVQFLKRLLAKNEAWAIQAHSENPEMFETLKHGQKPKVLWIGCSDSRVPGEVIADFKPGEVFVHRNIANLAVNTDFSFLSVLQYAVEVLEVEDIIVCGHTNCGGVKAACQPQDLGLIENWLRNIRDVARLHDEELRELTPDERVAALIELNVVEQTRNIFKSGIFQSARARSGGVRPGLHGLVYDVGSGRLRPVPLHLATFVEETSHIYKLIRDVPTLATEEDAAAALICQDPVCSSPVRTSGERMSPSFCSAAAVPRAPGRRATGSFRPDYPMSGQPSSSTRDQGSFRSPAVTTEKADVGRNAVSDSDSDVSDAVAMPTSA